MRSPVFHSTAKTGAPTPEQLATASGSGEYPDRRKVAGAKGGRRKNSEFRAITSIQIARLKAKSVSFGPASLRRT